MPLVQPPGVVDWNVHLVHLLECQPKRLNGALQHRRVSNIEHKTILAELLSRLGSLLQSFFTKSHVGPAGEKILLVPHTFAMSHEHELIHECVSFMTNFGNIRTEYYMGTQAAGRRLNHDQQDGEAFCFPASYPGCVLS